MPGLLGKRKRRTPPPATAEESEESDHDVKAAFARHFNAHFAPLPAEPSASPSKTCDQNPVDQSPDTSDWDGFSSEASAVEVVEHKGPRKRDLADATAAADAVAEPDHHILDADEKLNLKHDRALHQLIRESHLLGGSDGPARNSAQKILDLRLRALGSKTSLLEQERMPMSHRKGIKAKKVEREERRRREARESGVILEKAAGERKQNGRRMRAVDAPAVGKFMGGTLKLSRRDVEGIKGPPVRRGKR